MSRVAFVKKDGKYYAKTTVVPLYWKYYDWTLPKLTSGNSNGIKTFYNTSYDSSQKASYQAFSPNTGTIITYQSLKTSTFYLYIYTAAPLIITKFQFYVPINGTENNLNGGWAQNLILRAQSGSGWIEIGKIAGGANMGNKTHTMNLSTNNEAYSVFRFQGSTKGSGHNDELEIKSIYMEGKMLGKGTPEDYDYITYGNLYYGFKKG